MATLKKSVSKGSQSWRPLPSHTQAITTTSPSPSLLPPEMQTVGKRKLFFSFKAQYWWMGHCPLRKREAKAGTGWASLQACHPRPALSKLMALFIQAGAGQALPGGNGRRKQTEPQHAQDCLAHQTTQGGGFGPVARHCQHLVATVWGQHCQITLWLTVAVGKGFLNKSLG